MTHVRNFFSDHKLLSLIVRVCLPSHENGLSTVIVYHSRRVQHIPVPSVLVLSLSPLRILVERGMLRGRRPQHTTTETTSRAISCS